MENYAEQILKDLKLIKIDMADVFRLLTEKINNRLDGIDEKLEKIPSTVIDDINRDYMKSRIRSTRMRLSLVQHQLEQ